ncbi:MAG: PAS domain-containing sensor histidine kinase [Syntrophobacteraceae bacterium]
MRAATFIPPDQKVLGVLDIDVSLQATDERVHIVEAKLLMSGLATALALACLIKFLTYRFLNQPLRVLIEGTQRIAQEDLDFQIPIRTEDELGIFAQFFNQMTRELKRAKQSLTDWGNRLEQMVCERTKDLQDAQQQLVRSEKLASLGKLAAGVAHEINNPLTGVLTFSQLLRDQFPPETAEHQDLSVIVNETVRCRGIVRGLLEFARQTAPEKKAVDVHEIVEEVLRMVTNQELFQNIEVHKDYDLRAPHLMVDRDQIKQVMLNIVVNAAEAMGKTGDIRIRSEWKEDRAQLALYFIDNGPGIEPEVLNKLFDPFFTTKEMGTGLGMAISYGIVKGHRGSIDVISEPGKGCEVIVTLPAGQPAPPDAEQEPQDRVIS